MPCLLLLKFTKVFFHFICTDLKRIKDNEDPLNENRMLVKQNIHQYNLSIL